MIKKSEEILQDKILPVIELYTAMQGEGSLRGHPIIVVRTTGCPLRCYFNSSREWCDTWYYSIHPKKGIYTFRDIERLRKDNSQIKELMLTGGSPTMHPNFLNQMCSFKKKEKLFLTLETEGSHFTETVEPIDLVSISPKFSNSIPIEGSITPRGKIVNKRFVDQHNKHRLNIEAIKNLISYHKNYQIKPVCDGSEENIEEIRDFIDRLKIPGEKVYLMPEGSSFEEMRKNYPKVLSIALKYGFRFTGRDHIVAFGNKALV